MSIRAGGPYGGILDLVQRDFFGAGRIRWADGYPALFGSCSYTLWFDLKESRNASGSVVWNQKVSVYIVDCQTQTMQDASDVALVELVPNGRIIKNCYYPDPNIAADYPWNTDTILF